MTTRWHNTAWLVAASLATSPAFAADASNQGKLEKLEDQIESLQYQIQDLKAGSASKFAEQQRAAAALPKITFNNGRPTVATADGAFSIAFRSIVQFDSAYYIQDNTSPIATAQDLSSGTNFRRARIGFEGKVYTDWDYSFIYDFGGSGVEGSTISQAYIQYNGLPLFGKTLAIRVGAFPPYATLEDSAGAADTLFLERASAVETARGIAGGDGRSALSVTTNGDRYFASIAYTGSRVGQSGFFDEQQAVLGRLAYLLVSSPDLKLVVGGNGSYVFDPADSTAGPGAASTGINFQNSPELRVDDTGTAGATLNLVSTGNLNSDSAGHWGVDAGANWKNFYAEGGYFGFFADRKGTAPDVDFDGWYAQASWIITGETRRYDAARASFRGPNVVNPVGLGAAGAPTGWGAWEIAARYSTINLNSHEFDATAANRVRGGEQSIWTAGVNWYANNAIRVGLNYQIVDVDRLNAGGAQIGQDFDALSLRIQFSI